MSYQTCEDCGCRIYNGHCVNCHEETFIAEQYRNEGMNVPESILEEETEQSYNLSKAYEPRNY
jgi:hypothetical protein